MTFFDDLSGKFKKIYVVPNVKCSNCGQVQEVKIPKGNLFEKWIKSEAAICENCGVSGMMDKLKYERKEEAKKDDKKRDDSKRDIRYW